MLREVGNICLMSHKYIPVHHIDSIPQYMAEEMCLSILSCVLVSKALLTALRFYLTEYLM